MRSNLATLVLGLVLGLGAASAAWATPQEFSGKIGRVDASGKSLTVKTSGVPTREMTFTLAADAKIMAGPQVRSLGDLKVGEQVKVSYLDEGKSHRAQKIDVVRPGRVAAPAAKPAQHP